MGSYELQIYDTFGVAKDAYPGIECGGLPEKPMGPLRLQGDHGPVAFRNIRIRPMPVERKK